MTKDSTKALQLRQLLSLLSASAEQLLSAWETDAPTHNGTMNGNSKTSKSPPEWEVYQAQRTTIGAAGMITDIVSDPAIRLLEISGQFAASRALHIVAEHNIPELLESNHENKVQVVQLSSLVGIEQRKLARIMRCLCSVNIFKEVEENVFANSPLSLALVGNDPLRAYVRLYGMSLFTAADSLPRTLVHPVKGPSYSVTDTPWQDSLETEKDVWEWLEERVPVKQNGFDRQYNTRRVVKAHDAKEENYPRPMREVFALAMVGGGRATGAAHVYDYPWGELGSGIVVDVGGGVGSFCLELSLIYPKLNFVVQDRDAELNQGETNVWPQRNPQALEQKRVTFMPHDFFNPNPVKGADIYWLRYILHDWSDEYCVRILRAIKESMSTKSRILICDQLMNTTLGCAEIESAPRPLPANYGANTRYSHHRDLIMMLQSNGIERTPTEMKDIVQKSGLKLNRVVECRSQVSLMEIVLA